MTRRFTSEIINEIGPEKDIPAPDVGTDAQRDGVDLRHLLDEQGPLRARRRHRQAALDRRLARPRGGDGARRALLHRATRSRRRTRRSTGSASPSRASATSAAISRGCSRRRGRSWSRSPTRPAASTPRRGSTCRWCSRTRPSTERSAGFAGARCDHERRAAGARVRRARPVRARAGDPRGRTRRR